MGIQQTGNTIGVVFGRGDIRVKTVAVQHYAVERIDGVPVSLARAPAMSLNSALLLSEIPPGVPGRKASEMQVILDKPEIFIVFDGTAAVDIMIEALYIIKDDLKKGGF